LENDDRMLIGKGYVEFLIIALGITFGIFQELGKEEVVLKM
jgi:hypothetical protein